MQDRYIKVKSFGTILPLKSTNSRIPYEHQKNAMNNLDIINSKSSYSTMLVLPTGAGKTYTASMWLLKNAINQHKKILWLSHRNILLEQAAESFKKFAYAELIPNISSFQFRIVSGDSQHDRAVNISPSDDLLIVSKDSIRSKLNYLDSWLKNEKEIFFVIDEAHHSIAKTYRKIIEYVKERVANLKLIGLTATPFRTDENEKGLLAKIYKDGISEKNKIEDNGITYHINLKELINKQILSKPVFESYYTDEMYGENLGIDDLESVRRLDILPTDIKNQMANSAQRNKFIVSTYKAKQDVYGQTIVFAVNIIHAIQLNKLFNAAGIKSEFIVSDIRDATLGITISKEENERKIQDYKQGKIQVLVNVNIITEGVDLPQTKTVFLARPTVSTVLMTQMVGRALRGVRAGGTSEAYIVSFIDNWNEHIAWVNPDCLFKDDSEFKEITAERIKREINLISISKIEEFAMLLNNLVDTEKLEKIPFIERIPVGMYSFSYLEKDGVDCSYQVMVYNSTKQAYEDMMNSLETLFNIFNCDEEYPSEEILDEMAKQCEHNFFSGEMIPPYEARDIVHILKYYAQYENLPKFYTFDEIDNIKNKLDISRIAKYILEQDMRQSEKQKYLDDIWEKEDENLLKLFFRKKMYFLKQIEIELLKNSTDIYEEEKPGGTNVINGEKKYEDLSLIEIRKIDPKYEKVLRDRIFEKFKNDSGEYYCAKCKKNQISRLEFHVDHIKPMSKGGKTIESNLQILCRKCNLIKGDKYE